MSASFISKNCSLYLNSNHTLQFLHYQALSGFGFNKLGFYSECIADSWNQFYLVEGKSTIFDSHSTDDGPNFMSGICFNSICSAQDLQYALGSFSQYLSMPFQLVNVQKPSLIEEKFESENITVLAVLSILILLFLVSSVIDFLKKIKKINYDTRIVEIFSVFTTFKLLQSRSERNKERVKTFSGVKTLCLIGIMMTNIGIIAIKAPTTSVYSETENGYIYMSFYAADIWLMVSGFFLSYLLLKQYTKLKSIKVLLLKILRRFLRLWPLYILSILLNSYVFPLAGSGPLWPLLIDYPKQNNCVSPSHIFMVSNFFDTTCYNWLWLFQLDFQLCFIFVPVLILYIKWQKKLFKYVFFGIQLIFFICSILVAFLIKDTSNRNITAYFFIEEYSHINILPITRGSGFIIGYNLGIIFYNFKKEQQKEKFWVMVRLQKKIYRVMLPLIGILGFMAISCYFSTLNSGKLDDKHIFFFSALHSIFPLIFILILTPSLFGYWSPLKNILQSWVCSLISKLSISLYSAHFMVTIFMIYYRQNDLELSSFTIIFMACCTILPSIILAIILTTIVEIPVFVCKKVFSKTERITYFQH